jgi:hypothetical protein
MLPRTVDNGSFTTDASLSRTCGLARWGGLLPIPSLGDGDILEYHLDCVNPHFFGHAFDHFRGRQEADIASSGRLLWKAYEKV